MKNSLLTEAGGGGRREENDCIRLFTPTSRDGEETGGGNRTKWELLHIFATYFHFSAACKSYPRADSFAADRFLYCKVSCSASPSKVRLGTGTTLVFKTEPTGGVPKDWREWRDARLAQLRNGVLGLWMAVASRARC